MRASQSSAFHADVVVAGAAVDDRLFTSAVIAQRTSFMQLPGSGRNAATARMFSTCAGITAEVKQPIIDGGPGDDYISMESTTFGSHAYLSGGDGNDTFAMSPSGHDLSFLLGAVSMDGGNDYDQMFLYDDNSFSNGTYVIRDDAVLNVNTAFQYSGLEDLELDGAMGSNTITVESTPSARPLRSTPAQDPTRSRSIRTLRRRVESWTA